MEEQRRRRRGAVQEEAAPECENITEVEVEEPKCRASAEASGAAAEEVKGAEELAEESSPRRGWRPLGRLGSRPPVSSKSLDPVV